MKSSLPLKLLFFYFLLNTINLKSQDFVSAEKELSYLADVMINTQKPHHRTQASLDFKNKFSATLKEEGSFHYAFDSLIWISQKKPSDVSFRIFTWIIDHGNGVFGHHGIIQLASGKVIELTDKFKDSEDWEYSTEDKDHWMGAMYYHLMEDIVEGKKQYLLFGFHRFDNNENVKLLDVLYFDESQNPLFGKEIFYRKNDDSRPVIKSRVVLKYDLKSYVGLHYNEGMKMIVHDHLIPKVNMENGSLLSLVSDGSLVGYEKKGNYWMYIDKIATQVLDEAPRPNPVLDKRSKDLFGKDKK